VNGAHPDHAGFAKLLGDTVGMVHVGCPLATPLIELAPSGRLDSDGVGHVGSFDLWLSYRQQRRSAREAVTVHPLAQGAILPCQQREDGTTGDAIEAVELAATTEANPNATLQGIDGHSVDSVAADGVDSDHGSFAVERSLQGQRRIRSPAVYSASAVTFRTGWRGCHRIMAASTISTVFMVRLFFTGLPSCR